MQRRRKGAMDGRGLFCGMGLIHSLPPRTYLREGGREGSNLIRSRRVLVKKRLLLLTGQARAMATIPCVFAEPRPIKLASRGLVELEPALTMGEGQWNASSTIFRSNLPPGKGRGAHKQTRMRSPFVARKLCPIPQHNVPVSGHQDSGN